MKIYRLKEALRDVYNIYDERSDWVYCASDSEFGSSWAVEKEQAEWDDNWEPVTELPENAKRLIKKYIKEMGHIKDAFIYGKVLKNG
jgi:uncharacterized Zn finger protein